MINFKDKDLPVPSYPFIVDAIKIVYEPMSFLTIGKGMAAASSMTKSSAY